MKTIQVAFVSEKVKANFEKLKQGKFEDRKLASFIERAMDDLKQNPSCGIKVPKKLWPMEFVKIYNTTNLWKYDLPNAWRLIYTIESDEVEIVGIILEWFDHKNYERRFNY